MVVGLRRAGSGKPIEVTKSAVVQLLSLGHLATGIVLLLSTAFCCIVFAVCVSCNPHHGYLQCLL
jgi:uncharacterized membrane protein